MLDKIALAHSLEQSAMAHLARMGWRVLDISRVAPMLHPMFTQQHGHHWPRANNGSKVLRRKDGNWCATRLTDCALRSLRSRERKSALEQRALELALELELPPRVFLRRAPCGFR